ncbi:MAG: tRNA epoxyqueuosine(34) reductase QueG [Planctomycetota bacterium]|nr:MAG: tRNA epoxyqueuosine(34) reductase QueG [Planctomycetota bacterium]
MAAGPSRLYYRPLMTPSVRTKLVKAAAQSVGFDAVGVTLARPPRNAAYYRDWLAAGHAGSMAYLAKNVDLRENPSKLLAGCRSVVCVAVSYARPEPGAEVEGPKTPGRIARYARGVDYHMVLKRMLAELDARLRRELGDDFESRACVDTAPIIERELAAAAGLGWIGKNTLVLNARLGSYTVLGELFTTLDLAPDAPATDHCGTCTRCLDACPTQAFPQAYRMDASRCISYTTIEHRGEVPASLAAASGAWVFGCDVCQEVCPFNAKAAPATNDELRRQRVPAVIDAREWLELRAGAYRRLTRGAALRRATRRMLRRNAAIALGNSSASQANDALRRAADDPDPLVAGAAREALHTRKAREGDPGRQKAR